ncbi:hypothetical protein [Bdellovibrio sp. HCB-110]|uniref:hypothetical protein n=1 Tax=Bdellovibrio sp. HCB-110 TaxID=3391182 RepID=UPI0039B4994A
MKKFTAGIIVGILIGFGLSSLNKNSENDQNIVSSQAENFEMKNSKAQIKTQEINQNPFENKMELLDEKKADISIEISKEKAIKDTPETNKNEISQTHLLNLDISEEQIVEMEQHLGDLQKDVSLFRDNKGWIVRFHTQNNLLSKTGLKDNDLIRFGQIERLKEDPNNTELISRLEAIIMSLQR